MGRRVDPLAAGEIGAGDAARGAQHFADRALEDDFAPAGAGLRADLDHMVGGADHRLVVLDDDDGVAGVRQGADDAEEPVDVPRVQADGGLVEDEERVDQRGAEARGEVDALDFAAGEGAGGPVERQVAQPHLFKVAEAGDNGVVGERGAVGLMGRVTSDE